MKLNQTYDQSAVLCSKQLMKTLIKSFKINNQIVRNYLQNYDACLSDLCNVAMLYSFKNGLSHNPKEFITEKDIESN